MVKVISYNILSPNLCHNGEFMNYEDEQLDPIIRRNRLVLLIDEWTSDIDPPIIALQEVSYEWKGVLEKIFMNRNYRYYGMNYGNFKNGFFGIGIAIPEIYKVEKIDYIHLSEHIKTAPIDEIYQPENGLISKLRYFLEDIISEDEELKKVKSNINDALHRPNFLIRLILEKDYRFAVYNYHMPCAFKTPVVQTLHVDGLKRVIRENDIPTILATDFNLIPESDGYNYMTSAIISGEHYKYLDKGEHRKLKLQSTFKMINGKEPSYTCFSNTKWGGEFKNCLDYIFISNHFTTVDSKLLIYTTDKMPNNNNPSDHLPLQSQLELMHKD